MPKIRMIRAMLVTGAVASMAVGVGCSKTADTATPGTTQPGTTSAPAPADAASAGGVKATCDPTVLVPVIQQKYGPPGVDHLVCLVPNAILTVKTGGDDTVAFLVQKGGTWVVAADGTTTEADKLVPKDFPMSMLRSWQDKRSPAAPTTASAAPKDKKASPSRGVNACGNQGADQQCVPPPTVPDVATTKRPTTTAAPTTEAPVTTPAPPTTFSQFCLENPLDPSCSGKK